METRRSYPLAPEQGQLVNVRSSRWIVSDVARGTLHAPASPAYLETFELIPIAEKPSTKG